MDTLSLYNCNCYDFIKSDLYQTIIKQNKVCIITDPPFNIGYHYKSYNDKLKENEYFKKLKELFLKNDIPFIVVLYPEKICRLSMELNLEPTRIVSWIYNSNTGRQHRDIAFYNIKPNFALVKQPYKNPHDKRIKERIKNGKIGCKLYDWWQINQVKNVSKNKFGIDHPCIMPLEVMKNIIGIIPTDYVIFDPFMGSGTTAVACQELGRTFIGCEIDTNYFSLVEKRLKIKE